jgi:uncharacterized membrane protein YdjX (TVP38/TMEM64 family)
MVMTDDSATDDRLTGAGASKSGPAILRFVPVAVILIGLGVGYILGLQDYLSLQQLVAHRDRLIELVAGHTAVSALVFFCIYTVAVAFSFPAASALTIVGGFLFGWLVGGLLTVFAATIGATALFLAARFACGNLLKRRAGRWLGRFAEGFRENAFGYLLVLRLAPVFPFFVVNVAPAFFGIGLWKFVAATFLGIIPATFAYAYLGAGLDSVIGAAAKAGHAVTLHDFVTPQITAAFLVLAAVAAVPAVVRKLRARRTA